MREISLPLLRCPAGCKGDLALSDAVRTEGVIERGVLTCPGCGSRYGIESAIARMLPGGLGDQTVVETASEEVERKRSEMAARDAQVEDYDKMRGLAMFSHIEIPVTMKMLDLQPNDLLLEAGCGTGRMTLRFAAACKDQMAVDFSFESLRVCRRKLVAAGVRNVDLVQADVCALPFRSERFDRVVSCQVLEHIPTPDSRERMISEIARTVKPGGRVVLSAYQHSLFTRLFGHKEGEHEGGIYYYRFHRPELRALLGRHLKVEQITGALVYHYLARCHRPAVI